MAFLSREFFIPPKALDFLKSKGKDNPFAAQFPSRQACMFGPLLWLLPPLFCGGGRPSFFLWGRGSFSAAPPSRARASFLPPARIAADFFPSSSGGQSHYLLLRPAACFFFFSRAQLFFSFFFLRRPEAVFFSFFSFFF